MSNVKLNIKSRPADKINLGLLRAIGDLLITLIVLVEYKLEPRDLSTRLEKISRLLGMVTNTQKRKMLVNT